jgi:hypothetical protein
MVECIVCFVGGLLVGWNFLPQPQFVKDLVDKALSLFTNKS